MAASRSIGALVLLALFSLVLAQGSIGDILDGIGDTLDGLIPSPEVPQNLCTDGVHIIGVRGHGQQGEQPYGNLTSAIVGIKQMIPRSTNDSVDYPRDPPPSPNAVGGKNLLAKIKAHAQRCPDMSMVLIGYSQGGIIAMNTVCGGTPNTGATNPPLSKKYLQQVIAVTVYGDETRTYGQPYNRGTCLSYGTLRRLNPQGCQPYSQTIRSWCDREDPLCCEGGTDRNAHALYPSKYDDDLVKFVVGRHNSFRKKQTV